MRNFDVKDSRLMEDWGTYREDNRRSWNARTAVHITSSFYDVPGFLAGKDTLMAPEMSLLPSLEGQDVLHLQCHFGQDTLSLARHGARVTGMDLSDEAIRQARSLAEQAGIPARFICSDIYDGRNEVQPATFDGVFTSYGTIGWLPDLNGWAEVIAHALRPGGWFVFVEFHPTLYLFDFETRQLGYPYFPHSKPITEESTGTYADPDAGIAVRDHFWSHPVSEIIQNLLDAGLDLEKIEEWDYSPYGCFPNMTLVGTDRYRFEAGPHPLPHLLGLRCRRKG
ncbi:MAG: class I SAM-dependent methyltransferase [Saprospiraceae bacterium]|nr:class I SAM-dependent methyltransferase [Saprospiraceae bacterium]